MRHQRDAGDNRISTVVAVEAITADPQHTHAVVVTKVSEWHIDLVADAEPVETEAQVLKDLVDTSGSGRFAQQGLRDGAHVAIAGNPSVAFRRLAVVQAQSPHLTRH
jgi:hypothetical protein